MDNRKVPIYTPRERKPMLLRACSSLFCIGTLLMWIFSERLAVSQGDMLIMTGIAVLLITFSVNSIIAEKRIRKFGDEIKKLREDCGKDNFPRLTK